MPVKTIEYTNGNVQIFTKQYNELMLMKKSETDKRIKQIQMIHSQCFCLTK